MRTEYLSSVLLSALIMTSLMVPVTLIAPSTTRGIWLSNALSVGLNHYGQYYPAKEYTNATYRPYLQIYIENATWPLHTYTFEDNENNKAWEYGDTSLLIPSDVPTTADGATAQDYQDIKANDDSRWMTSYGGANYDHQYYKFKIQENVGSIGYMEIKWGGYAIDNYGAPCLTYLSIWNRTTSSWELKDNDYSGIGDFDLTCAISENFENYIDPSTGELWIAVNSQVQVTCPILYAWTGDGRYEYVADVSIGGSLGFSGKLPGGPPRQPSQPVDYTIVEDLRFGGGIYKLVIGEDQDEITYLDSARLFKVYHPVGTRLYSASPIYTVEPYPADMRFHTARDPRPPVAIWDENGNDLLPSVEREDGLWTETGIPHRYDKITLDLGDLSDAERIKLLIKAKTHWTSSPPFNVDYAEVLDERGDWIRLENVRLPNFTTHNTRTFAIDITNWFKTDNYLLRFNIWEPQSYDYIAVDTSPDEWFYEKELGLNSAELFNKGISPNVEGVFYYDEAHGGISRKYVGNFTRYGDVTELVEGADDKFVIMPPGDAVRLEFKADFSLLDLLVRLGLIQRSFVFESDAYYKMEFVRHLFGENVCRVEPLPFHAMSYYPYSENEQYPQDEDHQRYLEEYNTRYIFLDNEGESSDHGSLYTNYVEVKVYWGAYCFFIENAGYPGENVIVQAVVTNRGAVVDNYAVEFGTQNGWAVSPTSENLNNVLPGENRIILVTVTIPGWATPKTWENFVLTVTSKTDNTYTSTTTDNGVWVGFGLDLVGGKWNLVGFPATDENTKPDNIMPSVYYMWAWDPVGGTYVSPPGNQPVKDNLGYWAWVGSKWTVYIGIPVTSENISLVGGKWKWNLVHFPATSANTTPENMFYGHTYYMWKWDPVGGTYVSPPSDQPVELGVGYWIWIDNSMTVQVPK